MKRLLVYSMNSAGNAHLEQLKYFVVLHMFVNDCTSAASSDLGVRDKFKQVDEFANTASISNEDQLYY